MAYDTAVFRIEFLLDALDPVNTLPRPCAWMDRGPFPRLARAFVEGQCAMGAIEELDRRLALVRPDIEIYAVREVVPDGLANDVYKHGAPRPPKRGQ